MDDLFADCSDTDSRGDIQRYDNGHGIRKHVASSYPARRLWATNGARHVMHDGLCSAVPTGSDGAAAANNGNTPNTMRICASRGIAPVAINAATLEATAIRRATTQVLRQLRSFTKSSVVRWDL
jgi:hypothetical protein